MGQTDSHGCSKRQLRRLLIHSRLRPHRCRLYRFRERRGITRVPLDSRGPRSFRNSRNDVISRRDNRPATRSRGIKYRSLPRISCFHSLYKSMRIRMRREYARLVNALKGIKRVYILYIYIYRYVYRY